VTAFLLTEFLPYQLAVAAARVSRRFGERYRREFGISIPEWRVLAHLSQAGSVSVRDVHERVDMDKSKVSRAASRLEDAGFLVKSPDPNDGRLVELRLTEAGRDLVARIVPMALEFQAEVIRHLGADAAPLQRGLARLQDDDRT
jgi:DNA-binding MarR family transcriptional regulator